MESYLYCEASYQSDLRSPLMLLNEVFGRWQLDHWWTPALTADQVDVAHIDAAIARAAQLTERHRQVLRLRFLRGLTFGQIGREMDISRESARWFVASAVRRCRMPYNLRHFQNAVPGWFNVYRA